MSRLQYELEKAQHRLGQHDEEALKDMDKLRKIEEAKRQSDYELRNVRDSRGKVFRGLNTQTEIAMVQFKRDFENMKKQLQSKDEIIGILERKVSSLMEANHTLRNGLQELNSLPRHESSGSDLDDDELGSSSLDYNRHSILNGHTRPSVLGGAGEGVNPDLLHVISQLDSGKFDS